MCGRSRTSRQQILTKSPTFGGDAGESPRVKVQQVVGSVEGEGLRTTPSLAGGVGVLGGDQSQGEIGCLSDSSHHPSYQRKG